MTVAGPSTGMKCKLPFKIEGRTFHRCTKKLGGTRPICSTKVDDDGHHVSGGGHWGECSPDCPTENTPTKSMNYNETGMSIAAMLL